MGTQNVTRDEARPCTTPYTHMHTLWTRVPTRYPVARTNGHTQYLMTRQPILGCGLIECLHRLPLLPSLAHGDQSAAPVPAARSPHPAR